MNDLILSFPVTLGHVYSSLHYSPLQKLSLKSGGREQDRIATDSFWEHLNPSSTELVYYTVMTKLCRFSLYEEKKKKKVTLQNDLLGLCRDTSSSYASGIPQDKRLNPSLLHRLRQALIAHPLQLRRRALVKSAPVFWHSFNNHGNNYFTDKSTFSSSAILFPHSHMPSLIFISSRANIKLIIYKHIINVWCKEHM